MSRHLRSALALGCTVLFACVPEVTADPNETGASSADSSDTASDSESTTNSSSSESSDSDSSTGDGDATSGDGDSTSGDGDSTSGDGDGDGSTGDGDGDSSTGDGDGDTTGDGDGDSGDGDTGATCQGVCLTPPGGAWSEIFAERDTNGDCGGAFGDELDEFNTQLTAGNASCGCSCNSNPTGGSCPQQLPFYNSTASCPNGPGSGGNVSVGQCFSNTTNYYSTLAGSPNGVSCGSGSVSENIPTPTWQSSVLACAGGVLGDSCEDAGDLCMAAPQSPYTEGRLCVSQAGNQTCPAGFPTKTVAYTGYDDTRDCPSTCSCSSGDSKCVASYTGYQGTGCGNPAGASSFDTDDGYFCILQSPISSTDSVIVTSNVVSYGSCSPSGTVNPTGSAVPEGETTICCTQ